MPVIIIFTDATIFEWNISICRLWATETGGSHTPCHIISIQIRCTMWRLCCLSRYCAGYPVQRLRDGFSGTLLGFIVSFCMRCFLLRNFWKSEFFFCWFNWCMLHKWSKRGLKQMLFLLKIGLGCPREMQLPHRRIFAISCASFDVCSQWKHPWINSKNLFFHHMCQQFPIFFNWTQCWSSPSRIRSWWWRFKVKFYLHLRLYSRSNCASPSPCPLCSTIFYHPFILLQRGPRLGHLPTGYVHRSKRYSWKSFSRISSIWWSRVPPSLSHAGSWTLTGTLSDSFWNDAWIRDRVCIISLVEIDSGSIPAACTNETNGEVISRKK